MLIAEEQWIHYKDEFHSRVSDLLNYIQTVSAKDIGHVDVIRTLIDMRHKVTDAYLHVFNFVEDTNVMFLEKSCLKQRRKMKGNDGCIQQAL